MLPPLVHVKDNDNCGFWGFASPYPHGDTHHFLLAPNSHMVSIQAEESQGVEQGWARTELGIIISAVFLPPLASVCLEFIILCFLLFVSTHFISPQNLFFLSSSFWYLFIVFLKSHQALVVLILLVLSRVISTLIPNVNPVYKALQFSGCFKSPSFLRFCSGCLCIYEIHNILFRSSCMQIHPVFLTGNTVCPRGFSFSLAAELS